MKVLKENKFDAGFPKESVCELCKSLLLVERDDVTPHTLGDFIPPLYIYTCPVCGRRNHIKI